MAPSTTKHELTTTTATGAQCILRSATTPDPVLKAFWWSNMTTLGWDRSYYDLDTYMLSSRSRGWLFAYEREDGPPRGHVTAAIFDNRTGWVAMFIMAADLRQSGFGRVLFQAVLDDFRANGTVYAGLDGVQEQVGTYERRGFQVSPLGAIRIMSRDFVAKSPLAQVTLPEGMMFKDPRQVDPAWLVAFEKAVTGFERSHLWTPDFLARPDLQGVVLLDTSKTGAESVAGIALLRRCPSGARFAPLYAHDTTCAEVTMAKALELATPAFVKACALPGVEMSDWSEEEIAQKARVTTEVWTGNVEVKPLFDRFGWRYDNVEHARMWLDGKPTPEQDKGGLAHKAMYAIYDAAIG